MRGKRGQEKQGNSEAVTVATRMPMREFRKAVMHGVFARVLLESDWVYFRVRGVMTNGIQVVLSFAREEHPRQFRNPAAALAELRKMGVTRVEVVMGEWDVELATLSMGQRPDVTARRLRRGRMTLPELMLEASKKDPTLAVCVPPGTVEPGPASRKEEYRLLEQKKLDELARRAREDDTRARADWKAADEAERVEWRRRSDAFIEEWNGQLERKSREDSAGFARE